MKCLKCKTEMYLMNSAFRFQIWRCPNCLKSKVTNILADTRICKNVFRK